MKDLSVKEATEVLNVSETTIRRMIKRGGLPNAYKKDRKNWIPQRDIDAYLEQQQQQAESVPEPETPSHGEEVQAQAAPEVSSPKPVAGPKPTPEPEEPAASVPEKEELPVPSTIEPQEPISTIAQPIDELETPGARPETPAEIIIPSTEESTAPSSQPVPYKSETMEPYQDREQSFKWVMLQATILSANWLEKIFRKLRLALERYKSKTFPDSKKPEDSDS